jgi:hypothetical protein
LDEAKEGTYGGGRCELGITCVIWRVLTSIRMNECDIRPKDTLSRCTMLPPEPVSKVR